VNCDSIKLNNHLILSF